MGVANLLRAGTLIFFQSWVEHGALARIVHSLHLASQQNAIAQVSIIFIVAVALLAFLARGQRSQIRAALLLYAAGIFLLFFAAVADATGLDVAAKAIRAAALVFGGFALVKLTSICIFDVLLHFTHLAPARILRDVMVAVGYGVVGLWLLSRAGVTLSGIVTTSAVMTAVIVFSLQDSLGNMLGGLVLQTEATIRVGDWVKIDETTGRVKEIRWRYIAIETRNWDTIIVPNSMLMKGPVLMLGQRSGHPIQERRWIYFNVDFRVPPTEVIRVVTEALDAETIVGVASEPKPNCILMEFKDSYSLYAARYWLNDLPNDDPTDSLVRIRIYFALQRAGISLSVPAYTTFVEDQNVQRKQLHLEREISQRLTTLDLARVELFNNMNEEERRQLAERLRFAPFMKGEIMTRQGAEAHWLYLLVKGSAEVLLTVESGERKRVSTLRAGDFFGEMSLLTGEPRQTTVKALEDAECYRLDRQAFNDVLRGRPEIAQHLSEVLARRKVEIDVTRQDMDAAARSTMMQRHQRSIFDSIYKMFGLTGSRESGSESRPPS